MMNYSTKLLDRNNFKLLLEGRSVSLDVDGLKKILLENCKTWCSGDLTKIYRGVSTDVDFMYIEPKNFDRESRGMQDISIYQNVMDLSEKWKEFPKRSQSIICTNSAEKADKFGTTYEVIPFDGAKIAVAPSADIWYSFTKKFQGKISPIGAIGLDKFNSQISKLTKLIDGKFFTINSKEDLVNFCNKVDANINLLISKQESFTNNVENVVDEYRNENIEKEFSTGNNKWSYNILLPQFAEKGTFKTLEELLDPVKNDFKLLSYDQDFKLINDLSREVWTDSNCILVYEDKIEWLISNIL